MAQTVPDQSEWMPDGALKYSPSKYSYFCLLVASLLLMPGQVTSMAHAQSSTSDHNRKKGKKKKRKKGRQSQSTTHPGRISMRSTQFPPSEPASTQRAQQLNFLTSLSRIDRRKKAETGGSDHEEPIGATTRT